MRRSLHVPLRTNAFLFFFHFSYCFPPLSSLSTIRHPVSNNENPVLPADCCLLRNPFPHHPPLFQRRPLSCFSLIEIRRGSPPHGNHTPHGSPLSPKKSGAPEKCGCLPLLLSQTVASHLPPSDLPPFSSRLPWHSSPLYYGRVSVCAFLWRWSPTPHSRRHD